MKRTLIGLVAWLAISPSSGKAQSLSAVDREQTAGYAAARQNPDGGFSADRDGMSTLGSTTASIRVLRYTGGSIPDILACIDFVLSCFDAETGGFSQVPGGEADVATTASGLMALSELRIEDERFIESATTYLSENARTFPEVRIAIAGFEAVARQSPMFEEWSNTLFDARNDDGTWGQASSLAFDTGGTAAAILRMGIDMDRKEAVIEAIRANQNPDGGWSQEEGSGSDLAATYRVMRAAMMLDAAPDLDALRRFVSECRRNEGGYAAAPSQEEPAIGATYMATILLRWADSLQGLPSVTESEGFIPLFNESDLTGWEGDESLWFVRDGMIVGLSQGLDRNEFLASTDRYSDFVFRCTFRMVGGTGNSGIQFRSERLPGHEMIGYQADIGEEYWGSLYDESRRNRVLEAASDRARSAVRIDGWNQYVIRAMGNQIRLSLNSIPAVDYVETDETIPDSGRFALQLHSGEAMEVQFRNLFVQPLPRPTLNGDPMTPGFHLRSRQADPEDRYTIFIPQDYDGEQEFPVVLFLHGAGERGDDGVIPCQVGLGPSIASDPSSHPYIAVFPQARETWTADSPDGARALAILDEVLETYKVDTNRIILTGLSMGGMGTWSIATAHPDRFSALIPVCGPGDSSRADSIRNIPTWGFVGDQDREPFVDGMRTMVRALRALGAPVTYTEYRGVGHNSWDRAYSEPGLVDWMLAPHRIEP